MTDFKDKDGYHPEIRLEYVDESGRMLNPKEAFRQLSHRFHGKGSGKRKTEKRQKKVEEEQVNINTLKFSLSFPALLIIIIRTILVIL